ncbi:MAG TPA: prephenate dehydrogenase/arogenate dehydrogenase family protein [Planctomycetaceae bacterium]|nr:prephenate dehydrogenase/arogenate dehydrogenase family protein [Planctomycetaceae bacterium]
MQDEDPEFERRVVIAGVGLIGGSIAAAVRERFPDTKVIGVGRNAERLAAAETAGLLTSWKLSDALSTEDFQTPALIVICLPVHMIAAEAVRLSALASDSVVITDAGSIKGSICAAIESDAAAAKSFVGSHPIAGGERGGFEHAEETLFEGRVCVVTPGRCETGTARVQRFWKSIGCRILEMSPDDHDRVLALTSHLPHVMAAATALAVGEEHLDMTGSGFRDNTRIAAGDPGIWQGILAGNREQVVSALQQAEAVLAKYRTALEQGDDDQVHTLLSDARKIRTALQQPTT